MSIDLTTQYPGKVGAATGNYPYGEPRNISAPGDGLGTPWEAAIVKDTEGFKQALLKSAGIVPSGTPDRVGASEYLQAIVEIASGRGYTYTDTGLVDAYVLDAQTNQQAPASLFDGMKLNFTPLNTNTGASTANPFGVGVIDIKVTGGVQDPPSGSIVADEAVSLVYRLLPSVHLELALPEVRTVKMHWQTTDPVTDIFVTPWFKIQSDNQAGYIRLIRNTSSGTVVNVIDKMNGATTWTSTALIGTTPISILCDASNGGTIFLEDNVNKWSAKLDLQRAAGTLELYVDVTYDS